MKEHMKNFVAIFYWLTLALPTLLTAQLPNGSISHPQLRQQLRHYVVTLAQSIGPRNDANPGSLAAAGQFIEKSLHDCRSLLPAHQKYSLPSANTSTWYFASRVLATDR